MPLAGLLAPDYLAARARLIDPAAGMPQVAAGNPDPQAPDLAAAPPQPEHGTSQVSVVDDAGNAVALTTTVKDVFGARLAVGGFMLNNELTDFCLPARRSTAAPSPTGCKEESGR